MAKQKGLFHSKGWKRGIAFLYGVGAAIVILGALFKILHLPGANLMLIVGMGTETVIFAVSAFEPLPPDDHYEWDKVFPQLHADVDVPQIDPEDIEALSPGFGGGGAGGALSTSVKLSPEDSEKLVEAQKKLPQVFEQLAASVNGLKNNVNNLADISDATVATNEFASKLKAASGKIDQLNSGYGITIDAMKAFSNSINEVKAYQEQIVAVTGNLGSLNKVYEMELADAKKHINSINQFYGGISKVMQNLVETSKDTDGLRQEFSKMTTNMKSLNTVYGNMLTAMRGGN
jgi:gliding motility-associated protein GldL